MCFFFLKNRLLLSIKRSYLEKLPRFLIASFSRLLRWKGDIQDVTRMMDKGQNSFVFFIIQNSHVINVHQRLTTLTSAILRNT